jgi:hypothetical protein
VHRVRAAESFGEELGVGSVTRGDLCARVGQLGQRGLVAADHADGLARCEKPLCDLASDVAGRSHHRDHVVLP